MDRGLLYDATADNDSPTPGYMLNEIARSTISNYQANTQLQDFLVTRLTHKSHNVKFKALLIIKHVCRTGRAEFKMEMTRKVDPLKECLQFRGPPDPLRGDEIYKRVRDAAKEALDAIFDSQMPVTTSAVAAANRIQGMGNDYVPESSNKPQSGGFLSNVVTNIQNTIMGDGTDVQYSGHPGATGGFSDGPNRPSAYGGPSTDPRGASTSTMTRTSSGGMVGLGNPNYRDAREDKTWLQKASEYASSSVSGYPPSPAPTGNSEFTYATNRGPNAIDSMSNSTKLRNGFGSNTNFNPAGNTAWVGGGQMVPDLPAGAIGMGRVGPAASDGSYERTMVEVLCAPGGLKAVPPESQLNEFLVKAGTLSPELVGSCLIDTLNADAWQSRIKALIVIAALVVAKDCTSHAEWWADQLDSIRALLTDGKAGVRSQAAKTLRVLGEDHEVSTVSRSVSPKPVRAEAITPTNIAAAKNDSLIDILDMGDGAPIYAAPVQHSPVHAPLPAPAAPVYSPVSVMPPVAPAPATDGFDMFAGMSLSDAPAPALVPMAAAPAPAPAASFGFDFLSDHSAPAPTSAPASSGSGQVDFFADLTPSIAPLSPSMPGGAGGYQPTSSFSAPVGRSHGSAISSSFVEGPKADHRNAFQEFTLPSSAPLAAAPAAQPIGAYNQGFPAHGAMHGGMMPGARPGTSALAPSMISPTAPRKAIPTTDALAAGSGFSFIGGNGPAAAAPGARPAQSDSFNFVSDAMKSQTRK